MSTIGSGIKDCQACLHFIKERLTEDYKWIGFCELDPNLQKRHFISSRHKKCEKYLPGICESIYNYIKSSYNGITKEKMLVNAFINLTSDEMDDLLKILIEQDYITSIERDGDIYYIA